MALRFVERYFHSGPGYNPFLIRPDWQVAQLNYSPELGIESVNKVERHNQTDEVFVLFRGSSILVAAVETGKELQSEVCRMEPGVTYNVPKGVWHWIVMSPGDRVLIVENAGTHLLPDVDYRELTSRECVTLRAKLDQSARDTFAENKQ